MAGEPRVVDAVPRPPRRRSRSRFVLGRAVLLALTFLLLWSRGLTAQPTEGRAGREPLGPVSFDFALRYAPFVRTEFQAGGEEQRIRAYADALNSEYPGRMVSLGAQFSEFTFYYSYLWHGFALNKNVDVAGTPGNSGDDVRVDRVKSASHILSVESTFRSDVPRLLFNLGWGLSTGRLTFRQRSPDGTAGSRTFAMTGLVFIYEPMVRVTSLAGRAITLLISMPVLVPIPVRGLGSDDFSPFSRGLALRLSLSF